MIAIHILLNGEAREIPSEVKLDQLLEIFSLPKQRVAIEVNTNVIRRADWPNTAIGDGDTIEVIHFVGGG